MDFRQIKETVNRIEMPAEMAGRIAKNIHLKENKSMKIHRLKPVAIAAVLALCLCIPLGAAAAGKQGFFADITNHFGAITGTVYENAADELSVSAEQHKGNYIVTVTIRNPDSFPYREVEELAIGSYSITDANGKILAEGKPTAFVPIFSERAVFEIPGDFQGHFIQITSFLGRKKADQDLPIKGQWSCQLP